MNDDEKEALLYRFASYQLPKVDFDAGFPSYVVSVHPYFFNQPTAWTKPAYTKYDTIGPQLLETYPPYLAYSYTNQFDISYLSLELSGNPADVAADVATDSDDELNSRNSRSLYNADAESRCNVHRESVPKSEDGLDMLPF